MFPVMPRYPEMVSEATNGQLQIKLFFFGEHPYSGAEVMGAIRDGVCQMGEIEAAYYAGTEPVLALIGGPLFSGSEESLFKLHEALLEAGMLGAVYDRYNMFEVAYWSWWGPTLSCVDRLATSMDSLKGRKIRVPTKQYADMVSWLGATPVTIAWGEVYTGLQRGIVDGATGALCAQRDSKWPEVCKCLTRWAEAYAVDRVGVNKDAFNELPADVQDAFLKATKEFEQIQRNQIRQDDALATVEVIDKYGCTLTSMPPEVWAEIESKAGVYLEEWTQEVGKGAPEAFEIVRKIKGW